MTYYKNWRLSNKKIIILTTHNFSFMKKLFTYRLWILMILSNCLIFSCQEKKYDWEPGISGAIYYPIAGDVNFGNAGYGSGAGFSNCWGWGHTYGAIVSGNKYKAIPKEVYIDYYSVVDRLNFEGKVPLPQEKLKKLFKKYPDEFVKLIVGMAPGGWIRVWFYVDDESVGKFIHIELAKAKLDGHIDESVGIGLRTKDYETWGDAYTYWQLHGVPYEAWAENEKEYNILIMDVERTNPQYECQDIDYSSLDGSVYYLCPFDEVFKSKLPADMMVYWKSKKTNILYDTHLTIPKNVNKVIEKRNPEKITLRLEIEEDEQHGIIYINTGRKEEKWLRFKNYPTDSLVLGANGFTKDIEYFIK